MLANIKNIALHFRRLFQPSYFGFVQGHSWITDEQIVILRAMIGQRNSSISREYEQNFSSLIGNGSGISFAAGRMAFFCLMKSLEIGDGDEVILPAFTCAVMPTAVFRTGAKPVFSDIDPETFGSSAEGIERRITARTKLIVAQHSFGIPCEIEKIAELARSRRITLVEDCAITLDSRVNGVSVGNFGDAAIFSTDHSKPMNTLLGGFLYSRNENLLQKVRSVAGELPELAENHQKRLFERLKFERKYMNPENYATSKFVNIIGKIQQKIFGKKNEMTFLEGDYTKIPIENYPYPAAMPAFLSQIGVWAIERWAQERTVRRELLSKFLEASEKREFRQFLPKAYFDKSLEIVPLRLAFEHPKAEKLLNFLTYYEDVSWMWFREPAIGCSDGAESLGYEWGSCPNAEKAMERIVNLPCNLLPQFHSTLLLIFEKAINATI